MKKEKEVEKNFNWSVENGDYERDEEATTTYQRRKARRKRIKLIISIILYIMGVSLIGYFILRNI
jgi:hypothetical protein